MSRANVPARVCTHCGYDLNGLLGLCPECGWPSELYTDRARELMWVANEYAKGVHADSARTASWSVPTLNRFIRPVHIGLGIVRGPDGVAKHALQVCGAMLDSLASSLFAIAPRAIGATPEKAVKLPLAGSTRKLAEFHAPEIARKAGHAWIGTEHLLLALLRNGPRRTVRCFTGHGATFAGVLDAVVSNNAGYHPQKTS